MESHIRGTYCMKIELFRVYKMVSQRAKRHPNNLRLLEIQCLTKSLLTEDMEKLEMLEVAEKIYDLESTIRSIRKKYSIDLLNAIENDNYYIEIPYQISHSWNEKNDSYGYVYVAISTAKPGMVKLGATTMHPLDRLNKYKNRYGYSVKLYWSKYTKGPFGLEKAVQTSISDFRVAALTDGDSNEWYQMDPSKLVSVIENWTNQEGS